MRKYSLTCAYCDSEFESGRSDALYCSNSCRTMNSRDNKQKDQAAAIITLKYNNDENQTIRNKADISGMTMEEYIKFISLNSSKDYSKYIVEVNELRTLNKELKAKLLFYTDSLEQGLFLDINEDTLFDMQKSMLDFGINFDQVEDYVVYASVNLSQLIEGVIKRTIKQVTKR